MSVMPSTTSFWDLDLIEGIKTKKIPSITCPKIKFWDLDLIEGIKTYDIFSPRYDVLFMSFEI